MSKYVLRNEIAENNHFIRNIVFTLTYLLLLLSAVFEWVNFDDNRTTLIVVSSFLVLISATTTVVRCLIRRKILNSQVLKDSFQLVESPTPVMTVDEPAPLLSEHEQQPDPRTASR